MGLTCIGLILALLLSSIGGRVVAWGENDLFSGRQRLLQGLPPCDSLVTEGSDFPAIQGTPLPILESDNVIVVNGQFFGDELARVDTLEITLASALSTLRLELFVQNSPSSGFYHDLLFMEDPLDQVYIADTFCGGGASGQATCVLSLNNVAAGTYTIRMFSEGVSSYQLQICADGCMAVQPPDYDDLTSCASSGGDTGGTHKYKIFKESFTATVVDDSTRLQIEGRYDVTLPVSSATGSFFYLQSVHVVDGDRCSSSTYSNAALEPIAGVDNVLQAAFQIDAISMPSSVYTELDATTGQIRLCHRIQLYRGGIRAILMNRVDTIVTTQINLSQNFNTLDSANVVTEASQTAVAGTTVDSSAASPEVSILDPITETAIVSPISSGQSIKVLVDTKSNVRLEQLSFVSVATNAGKTITIVQNGAPVITDAVVGNIDCETAASACGFTLTLPFEGFFDQAYLVQISGTAILSFSGSVDRRLVDLEATAGFDKAFLTIPSGQASAADLRPSPLLSLFMILVAATLMLGFA